MARTTDPIIVLDCSLVKMKTSAAETHVPLTYLDMNWLHFTPIQRLVFYEFPHLSRSQFLHQLIPKLKDSLSLALEYFPILAGNLIIPPGSDSGMPEIYFGPGSAVRVVFAECDNVDFNHLVGNDERACAKFHPLIPELKSSDFHRDHSESVVSSSTTPVLALQVTLFPDVGLSIGISNHHTVGDARSIFNFMKTWAILHSSKLSQDKDADRTDAELMLVSESQLPLFDKTLIKDTKGLAKIILDQWKSVMKGRESPSPLESTAEINMVRKTFVITQKAVEKLKSLVLEEEGSLVHVSSFTVICSYVWTCLLKSRKYVSEDGGSENEHFLCAADCRERSDPPVPANYFGNCLMACLTAAKSTAELVGENGFRIATGSLGRTIHEKFLRKDAVFDGAETELETIMKLDHGRVVSVAGSTRYNYYNLDFGWGNPIKFEFISIDSQAGAISLSGSRDSDGSVEVGVSLTKPEMDAFSSVFMEGIN